MAKQVQYRKIGPTAENWQLAGDQVTPSVINLDFIEVEEVTYEFRVFDTESKLYSKVKRVTGITQATKDGLQEFKALSEYTVQELLDGLTQDQINGLQIDDEAPSVPANFISTGKTETTIDVSWTASTDNVGVTGYKLYKDSVFQEEIPGTSYQFAGLTENTQYTLEVSAVDETGNESGKASINVTTSALVYYVRPSGSSYGTGEGLSYENAWSGFAEIDWEAVTGKTLNIAGTHNEFLDVLSSDLIIQGHDTDLASIDGQDILTRCFRVQGFNNVTINDIDLLNGLTDCSYAVGQGIVFNRVNASGAGNQGFQNEGTDYHVTYNNCTGSGCDDDGLSLHGGGTVVANDCSFLNNAQGVHAIGTATFTANRCVFDGNTQQAFINSIDSDFTINNSFVLGGRGFDVSGTKSLKINNCIFKDCLNRVSVDCSAELHNCYFIGSAYISNSGNLGLRRCYIKPTSVTVLSPVQIEDGGHLNSYYSIFNMSIGSNDYAVTITNGTANFYNCNFVSNDGTGRGVKRGSPNFINCLFYGLNLAFNPNGAGSVFTTDHCNVFNCTSKAIPQNGGTYNETNPVAGDPLLIDVANDDYSLGEGSSCIDTGTDTGFPEGIETAAWGDIDTSPVIDIKNQDAIYDIGAYLT